MTLPSEKRLKGYGSVYECECGSEQNYVYVEGERPDAHPTITVQCSNCGAADLITISKGKYFGKMVGEDRS